MWMAWMWSISPSEADRLGQIHPSQKLQETWRLWVLLSLQRSEMTEITDLKRCLHPPSAAMSSLYPALKGPASLLITLRLKVSLTHVSVSTGGLAIMTGSNSFMRVDSDLYNCTLNIGYSENPPKGLTEASLMLVLPEHDPKGCTVYPNPAAVAKNIVLIKRGDCPF